MAHEIESALFVGQPAWHGLGVVLQDSPSVEDAIRLSGLDWNVRLEDLNLNDGRKVDHRATVRDTDNRILGVVGPAFTPLQNKDAFGWFQPMIDSGTVQIEAAGSLRDGKRVWVLGKIKNGSTDIIPGDEVRQYILLAHAHDGSLAIRVGFTSVRVVCANTLSVSMSDKDSLLVKINHRAGAKNALDKVRTVLDVSRREFAATADQLRQLARVGCDEASLKRYVREVFEPGSADKQDGSKIIVAKVVDLFQYGRGTDIKGVRGTYWGAFNACTELLSHGRGRSADARVESQWFGSSAKLAERALSVGLEMALAT